jgi:hypothetical protein
MADPVESLSRAGHVIPRMRAMLGYSIHPPFIGQVDGMHPLRLVDPDYRDHKTQDHVVADRVLTAPQIRGISP